MRWLAGPLLLVSVVAQAQSVEELKQRLADKEAEVEELRARIRVLEREATRVQAFEPPRPDEEASSNRALERALVREGAALLPFGTFEIEPGFNYSHSSGDNLRRDAFGAYLEGRFGLPQRFQLTVNAPLALEDRRDEGGVRTAAGFGDPVLALSYQALSEGPWLPNLIATVLYKPQVGRNTTFSSTAPIALGTGFHALGASLTATKRRDPLVLFGSYSFLHNFEARKSEAEADIGDQHTVRFGTVLAASPDTSLRAAFDLSFQDTLRFAGVRVGNSRPQGIFEIGGSIVLTDRTLLDLTLGMGVTSNAPDFGLNLSLPVRF
jgi:hypothetical protein